MLDAIWDNLNAHYLNFGKVTGGTYCNTPECCWSHSGQPVLNQILGGRFTHEDMDRRVAAITAEAASWQTRVIWMLDPGILPPDLPDCLLQHGWVNPRGADQELPGWPAMAMPLDESIGKVALPEGLTITRVSDEDILRTWAGIYYAPAPDLLRTAFADVHCGIGCSNHLPWTYYLAYKDGQPVASSMLFTTGNIAGLYWIATLSDFRRQGIGTSITRYTMQQAQQQGCTHAVLFASDMGAPVYRRLGFEEYGVIRYLVYLPIE